MPQLPSINDNEVNLWKKLVLNTGGISPVPPGESEVYLAPDGITVYLAPDGLTVYISP